MKLRTGKKIPTCHRSSFDSVMDASNYELALEYADSVARSVYREAVESAVTECIKNGILAEFLKKNRAEVVAMSIFEFDEEKEWKKYGKAEYQYGVEVGTKRGIEIGTERGIEIGMQHGRQESLRVLIHSLRECSLELEDVYQKVKKQDIYRDVTFEVVKEIYISVQL